jgi:hypothetical protein
MASSTFQSQINTLKKKIIKKNKNIPQLKAMDNQWQKTHPLPTTGFYPPPWNFSKGGPHQFACQFRSHKSGP